MTATTITPLSPTTGRSALLTLAGIEARRTWRGAALWIGLPLSLFFGWNTREVDWSGGNYSSLVLLFVPLAGAAFVAGVRSAGKDVRADVPPLGEDAALGDRERSLARLLGLAPFLIVTIVGTAVIEIAIRIEGGIRIGDDPGRTDSAVHTLPELLQPAGLVVVAATAGVAAGRRFRHRLPIIALGVIVTFMNTGGYWVFQWVPMTYVTLVQTQPIEEYAGPRSTDPATFPAGWLLHRPDQYNGNWRHVTVDQLLAGGHVVYFIGLATLFLAAIVRGRDGRRLVLLACGVIATGLLIQLVATDFAFTIRGTSPGQVYD